MSKYIEYVLITLIAVLFTWLLIGLGVSTYHSYTNPQQLVLNGNWVCTEHKTKNMIQGKVILPMKYCVQYTKGE